jgi:hypothetical protein
LSGSAVRATPKPEHSPLGRNWGQPASVHRKAPKMQVGGKRRHRHRLPNTVIGRAEWPRRTEGVPVASAPSKQLRAPRRTANTHTRAKFRNKPPARQRKRLGSSRFGQRWRVSRIGATRNGKRVSACKSSLRQGCIASRL